MSQVIHIFGASGSGTTTLGNAICKKTGYYHMDSDDYFWLPTDPPFTEKRPPEERIELMKADIQSCKNVVISGSLCDWGDVLIPYFTLAVRIEIEPELRISRLRQREFSRFGSRIEPGGDMHDSHLKFLQWAKQYDTGDVSMRSKAKHDSWQKSMECRLITVNGADPLERNVQIIMKAVAEKSPVV